MARFELIDALKNAQLLRDIAKGQVCVESTGVYLTFDSAMFEQHLELGTEYKLSPGGNCVKERLFSDAVAGDKEALLNRVPDRKGKHPAEQTQAIFAKFVVGVNDRLGI